MAAQCADSRFRISVPIARIGPALMLGALMLVTGSAFANDGQLILVAGDVSVQRPVAGQAPQRLVPVNGTRVQRGDALITGVTGRAQIRFSDGSLVSLQPRSEFRIDDYQFDMNQQRGFFSLVSGALRTISGAVGKRDPNDYRMTTPTASIGIRGTEFLVEETICNPACHPGRTAGLRVAVSAGQVVVYNPAGSIELAAGNATYVAGPAQAPVPTSERPTMSTAPATFDPFNPAGTVRLAGLGPEPSAAGARASSAAVGSTPRRAAGAAPSAGAAPVATAAGDAAAADPRQAAGRRAAIAKPAGPLARTFAEGVPPALLDRWNDSASMPQRDNDPTASASDSGSGSNQAQASASTSDKADRDAASDKADRDAAPEEDDDESEDGDNSTGFAGSAPGIAPWPAVAIKFDRQAVSPPVTTSPADSPAAPDASASHPILAAALSPSGGGTMTAPINGATGVNAQVDAVGTPIAIATRHDDTGSSNAGSNGGSGIGGDSGGASGNDTGGSSGGGGVAGDTGSGGSANPGGGNPGGGGPVGGNPGSGNPGSGGPGSGNPGSGNPGSGNPGSGNPGSGNPGSGNPGGGTPVLSPGLNSADRVAVRTLQSPWFDLHLTAANAHVSLDSAYRLESIGLCPVLLCISRGTAQVADAGHNADVSWGRWVNGHARVTVLGLQSARTLGNHNGVHYLVGAPTVTMPTSGTAHYAIAGATSPTFASGGAAPGVFTGQGLVQFGAGQATRIGFRGDMVFGSGEHYHLFSNGARGDAAGRLAAIGDTQIRMTGRTTFSGNIGVVSQGSADRLGCGASNCQANLEGGFYGPAAARMGVGYSVGRTGPGGDTINGVAVLNRE